MINKKFMFLAIFLVSLLAVSAVNAADNATEDIVNVDETTDEVVSVENNDVGTFTDLANEVKDAISELNLTRDYTYDDSKDSNYRTGIPLEKGITINGNGFIINGKNRASAFYISAQDVVLSNINFVNTHYYASSYGVVIERGAITCHDGDNGVIVNCNFINSTGKIGGAVNWEGNNCTFSNCNFINSYSNFGDSSGGAIIWRGDNKCVLSNCNFINCHAAGNGGAVSFYGTASVLANCSFINCYSHYEDGGAVYWRGDDGTLSDCSFVNCSASGYGGGIYFEGKNCCLINPYFECNIASEGVDWYSMEPLNVTGVRCLSTILRVPNVSIIQGFSKDFTVTLSDSCNNFLAGEQVSITLNNVKYDLTTDSNGKASIVIPNNLDLGKYVTVISYGGNDGYGPSRSTAYVYVRSEGSPATFTDLACAILDGDNQVNLTENYLYDEEMDYDYKTGIIIDKSIVINGNGYTIDGNNKASVFDIQNEGVVLSNINFVNCSNDYNSVAGVIYWNGDDGILFNCTFMNCYSNIWGGAVSWESPNGTVYDCKFINCSSDILGGALHMNAINCTVHDCQFINCSSSDEAGAVYWSNYDSIMYDCSFVNCSARDAGAVYWNDDNSVMYGCSFINCSASNYDQQSLYDESRAGAVYWRGDNGILSDCSFVNCYVANEEGYGGAIYWDGNKGILTNCSFKNVNIISCKYQEEAFGGAVYWAGSDGILSDCSFVNCSSLHAEISNGGAVYWSGDCGRVAHSVFVNCSAESIYDDAYGGGIYFEGVNCSLINPSYFEGNTARYGPDWYSVNPLNIINETKIATVLTASDVVTSYKSDEKIVAALKDVNGDAISVAKVKIAFNGVIQTLITDDKGLVSVPLNNVKPGSYVADITFDGDEDYEKSSTAVNVAVNKADTIISAPDITVAYKDPNAELVATIINEHGKPLVVTLNVNLNGKTYAVKTDSNGQASIPIGTLSPGTYAATVSYKGSSNYKASSTTVNVKVTKAATVISASDVSVAYKDPNGELVATIISEHGKPLVVTLNVELNGKTYTVKTDSNGQARIPVGTLSPGTYAVTVSYKGSSNYKASSTTVNVKVTKAATVITASDVSVAYKDPNGELVATIISEHGKPLVVTLSVNINGKTYNVKTDSEGQASIPIDTLSPGTYTATISYKGSSNYKASTAAVKVTVNKASTVITAPDVNIAYKDPNGELVATIINEHGKPLVVNLNVNINGKDYAVRTDSNGQAFIPVGTLTPGTYTATISYKGSGNYKAASTTAQVVVTKAATIITAPDVTVAYKDPNGKLVSTIVNEHGKPLVVTMNVNLNGKTYSVKSDSNGQISVPTADLAPGTYTAAISYKGSSNYKASSTTASIQVN